MYARQAILTKYIGPTNHRPGRIKAWCDSGSLTIEWDHSMSVAANHGRVASELAKRLEGPYTNILRVPMPDTSKAHYAFVRIC